jgi:membrane protein required for colicin V production
MVLPFVAGYISPPQLALAAAIGGVFLATLIVVSFLTVKLSDLILDSRIGALDRTLGFLFGAARGLLIAVIAFVFFDKLVGDKQQPEWVRTAKLRPVLKETGDQIMAFLPDDPEGLLAKWKARSRNQGDPGEPPATPGALPPTTPPAQRKTENPVASPVYKKAEQQNLQQLIGASASPPPKP